MSKELRVVAAPKVVGQPSGVRIRTRLRTSQEDLDVLLQVGDHLGSLSRKDLAARVRLGRTADDKRASRKQWLTAESSSRWAGAVTRTSNDQWNLSWRALHDHRSSTRRAIAALEQRLVAPVGQRAGKARGYRDQTERFAKQQRLQILQARLQNIDARIQTGNLSVVSGGRGLLRNRHHLQTAGLTAQQWRQRWQAARLFLTADGESGRSLGNETLRVDPMMSVLSLRLPTPLKNLANAKHGRYEIPLTSLFSQHTDEWRERVLDSRAVRYDFSYDPVKDRVYVDASWKRTDVPETPSLETAVGQGVLAVDMNDGHLACRVLDPAGNPVGPAHTVRLDLEGLPASQRDGRLRAAISTLIRIATDASVGAMAIEDLNFTDARAAGRETMGPGTRGRRFRRTVAGIPTGKLRDRLGIENARRLHPDCRFRVASATELDLGEASLGGVLGWWSLFHLPRDVLPQVLAHFAHALRPGGYFITGTHVGDEDAVRTEAYGGVRVRWTTHKWQPEQLVALVEQAGLQPVAELRLPADEWSGPGVVVMAKRPG
ncbi:class I SAM-dependent methyltransferase [Streptomyces sp. NPDC059582]|uniref:class I SAM-dependent methyltransferase n=1 Tax=Streptomyces sp. NPDC059582 TaxID=3346875 RepID=UPI0036AA8EA6